MFTAVFNLVVGTLLIVGALTWRWTLPGTGNSSALVVIGGIIAAVGLFQGIKRWRP